LGQLLTKRLTVTDIFIWDSYVTVTVTGKNIFSVSNCNCNALFCEVTLPSFGQR
jgi:hypothetical protein